MSHSPRILIIGTLDTKPAEILYLKQCLEERGAAARIMDVGILEEPDYPPDYTNREVAAAGGHSLEEIRRQQDENQAMTLMAAGATTLTRRLYDEGAIDAMIALGGTMGTDLALDVALGLPLGVPKFVVSTIAYSHLIPPERLAPDLMMILWAGGLYGLNSICRTTLNQAAGAVYGAASAREEAQEERPRVAITSFGKSAAKWMVRLVPELEERGYEAAVFHATGMGGRAMEALATRGEFVAVMDFAIQEISNHGFDSAVTAGPDRLTAAGLAGIPQIVAPGFIDLVDVPAWRPFPSRLAGRPYHIHNRLLSSLSLNAAERGEVVDILARKLAAAKGPSAFILPTLGVEEWDRPDGILRNEEAIEAVNEACREKLPSLSEFHEIPAHINDDAFVDKALEIFDRWVAEGRIGGEPVSQPLTAESRPI